MFDVITIGSATIDIFADISCKVSECKLGDKVLVDSLKFETGGGGVNSAIALARMGLRTAFLGKLGHDHNAFKILHELKKEDVNVINTKYSNEQTAMSFVLKSSKEKDRIIFVHKGASDNLSYNDFKKSDLDTKWIYMATMMDHSFKTCEKISNYAKKNDIKLMFNPSAYLSSKGKKYLNKILKSTTVLVLNKSEAKLMIKKKTDNINIIVKELIKLGPEIAVVTEGDKGIYAYDQEKLYHLPAYKIKVINSAGAGDAFASGFLAGILYRNDMIHALELGMANAASVCKYYGTRNKLLSHNQAHNFISKRKEKVSIKDI